MSKDIQHKEKYDDQLMWVDSTKHRAECKSKQIYVVVDADDGNDDD